MNNENMIVMCRISSSISLLKLDIYYLLAVSFYLSQCCPRIGDTFMLCFSQQFTKMTMTDLMIIKSEVRLVLLFERLMAPITAISVTMLFTYGFIMAVFDDCI